jgi:hypothetical protein
MSKVSLRFTPFRLKGKRGCDQKNETIHHLLVSGVFARQFWFYIFQKRGLVALSPDIVESNFEAWWSTSVTHLNGGIQKGFKYLVILGA